MNDSITKSSSHLSAPTGGQGAIIPNVFTLLNLFFGCLAIVFILQTNETIAPIVEGIPQNIFLPEKIWWGSLFIFFAAIIDFLDGFLARMLKASSEMGKQLDSLSDVVSFGVAPGIILYQLLRMGYSRFENGLDITMVALFPAFLYTCFVAWRLAKFNIADNQSYHFRGVPSPAAGLLIASFPLIYWYEYFGIQSLFVNPWFLYAVILLLGYLMLSNQPFMAIKFQDFSYKNNLFKYILLFLSLVLVVALQWLAVPVIFILYLAFSFFSKQPNTVIANKETDSILPQ